jgi:hypothetical protein
MMTATDATTAVSTTFVSPIPSLRQVHNVSLSFIAEALIMLVFLQFQLVSPKWDS